MRHIARLPDLDSIPFDRPRHFALQSRDEAANVGETLADAFTATDHVPRRVASAWRRGGQGRGSESNGDLVVYVKGFRMATR